MFRRLVLHVVGLITGLLFSVVAPPPIQRKPVMSRRFIFDFGNSRGKWYMPFANAYGDFVHAVAQLTPEQWERNVGSGKPTRGFIRVNGIPYAVGEAALPYAPAERPKGAARYTESYYGPALCFALTQAIKDAGDMRISLYASHAPKDHPFAKMLKAICQRQWTVESANGTQTFNVSKVETYDEPHGGYAKVAFTAQGGDNPNSPVVGLATLVIDVGGKTTDHAKVAADGSLDRNGSDSIDAGTNEVLRHFERALRRGNLERFQNVHEIDINRLENALITGVFQFGTNEIKCGRIADEALTPLVNEVVQLIISLGGAVNFDVILLTGGGSALIIDRLRKALPGVNFVLADEDRSMMKYANVRGGGIIATLLGKGEM